MKTLTVRLPDELLTELEAASREHNTSVSGVVRDRIASYKMDRSKTKDTMALIGDLVGSVDGLPSDLSSSTKHYLKSSGYGKRAR